MSTRQPRDAGFAITTLLLIASVATAVIVGGSSTAASVMNREDIREAAGQMDYVAADVRLRTQGDESPEAKAMRAHADKMNAVSDAMTGAADKELLVNLRNNLGDAVLTPLQGGAVITAAKFAWDVKTGWELGDTALKSWGITDPGADPLIAQLQELQVPRGYTAPVEQAIVEAKLKGARVAVSQTDPGLSPGDVDRLAAQLVVDVETAGANPATTSDPYRNGYLDDAIASQLGWTAPDLAATGGDTTPGLDTPIEAPDAGTIADGAASADAGEWIKFLFSAPGSYWSGAPDSYAAEQAIRASAEGFLGAQPGTRIEVLAIGPTDAEGAAWPVRFRMVGPDAEGNGVVFLTLVYSDDEGMFASPIFIPDLVGGARAALSD